MRRKSWSSSYHWRMNERDYTVIMVTHNREIAERADVRLVMKDGRMTMEQ